MTMLHKTLTLGLTAVLVLSAGCAGLHGASDEEQVADVVEAWKTAFQTGDTVVAQEIYSEDFTSDFMANKEAVITFLQNAEFRAFLADADIDTADAVITIDGDTATVEPIYLDGGEASFDLRHTLAKEDDGWKITRTDGSGS